MAPIPTEIRLVALLFILLLVGLIAAYHVWLDRHSAARERLPETGATPVEPVTGSSPASPQRSVSGS
jgi:hypothetical protein